MKNKQIINETFRRIVLTFFAISIPVYLFWRIFFTLNIEYLISSGLFLLADFITCFATLGFIFSLWNLKKKKRDFLLEKNLKVDVWIPTYNESIDILRRTIYSAVNMDYPHKTYVLDDGNRKEVKELAKSLGADYICRRDNKNGKAGNLNNALRFTDGDFIASFDADFIPQKDFLTKLLGYFSDEKVALVQAPQNYYNLNSFQHKKSFLLKRIWSEQDSFFNLVMEGRNNWNAAFWIGTNAIIQRKAVESIGGFPTDSIVEDMLTSILLHAKKWKTVYANEPLAFGIAPSSLKHFLTQRLRWSRGVSQILRKRNPLCEKGLKPVQKFFYLSSIAHFFEGTSKLIYYFLPALYLLTGITPVKPEISIIAIIFSYVIFTLFSIFIISRGKVSFYNDEVYGMSRFFTYFLGNLELLFNRKLKFAVTPKKDSKKIQMSSVFGPVIVFVVNISAVIYTMVLFYNIKSVPINFLSFCVVFCIYFAFISFQTLRLCFSYPFVKSSEIEDFSFVEIIGKKNKGILKELDDSFVRFLYPDKLSEKEKLKFGGEEFDVKIIECRNCLGNFYEYYAKFDLDENKKYKLISYIYQKAVKKQNLRNYFVKRNFVKVEDERELVTFVEEKGNFLFVKFDREINKGKILKIYFPEQRNFKVLKTIKQDEDIFLKGVLNGKV